MSKNGSSFKLCSIVNFILECMLWLEKLEIRKVKLLHIISKCSKAAENWYKTRHDWVGKVIHWELFNKFKFDCTNNWYMHSLESAL